MKRFLIPETGQFYKANLHSHSTVSDGTLTPAQMKELYRSRGYSVLACTDHELMVPHHDLTDDGFVMLTGFELGFDEGWRKDFLQSKVCDLCLIAIDPDNELQPCYHRKKYIPDDRRPWVKYDEREPDFEREYNPDCINEAIRIPTPSPYDNDVINVRNDVAQLIMSDPSVDLDAAVSAAIDELTQLISDPEAEIK